jgi:hypothetical protein
MKRKKRKPDSAAGRLMMAMGAGSFALSLFSSFSPSQRFSAAAGGCSAFLWGLKEVAAAKKWEQEPDDKHFATSAKDIIESE